MVHIRTIEKELDWVLRELKKELETTSAFTGEISPRNQLKLQSKANYGAFSMIEKAHFTLTGRIEEKEGATHVKYKVRGNNTFSILAVIIPIMSFPTFLFSFIGPEMESIKKAQTLPALMVFTLIIAIVTLLFLWKEKSLKKKGEKAFEQILDSIQNQS